MATEIIVTVDVQGNTTIETRGFKGADCLKATADLEKALGAKTSDTKTREYHQTTGAAATVKQ
jgi:hypothetical protein